MDKFKDFQKEYQEAKEIADALSNWCKKRGVEHYKGNLECWNYDAFDKAIDLKGEDGQSMDKINATLYKIYCAAYDGKYEPEGKWDAVACAN